MWKFPTCNIIDFKISNVKEMEVILIGSQYSKHNTQTMHRNMVIRASHSYIYAFLR